MTVMTLNNLKRADVIAKFEGQRVPRYTSYPAAPHFTETIDDTAYQTLLTGLPEDATLSLYLHVPFCQTLCWYCGCHTRIVDSYSPIEAYLRALEQEIEMVSACLPGRMAVGHIHWGGGTPTIMAPESFKHLMDVLRDRFDLRPDAEVGVEIDPRRITDSMITTLGESGATRASLGVQSFDPVVQQAINRIQSFEQTANATKALRSVGIDSINFDLIYGLPFQTIQSCDETVLQALKLAPAQFSVFGYAHVPWMKKHQRLIDSTALPDGSERLAQFAAISDRLESRGYRRIGLDHFAAPDDRLARCLENKTLRRNFQGYTSDQCSVLLGFGASAIGTLPHAYVQNTTQVGEYRKRIEAGSFAIQRGKTLSSDDRFRREIIERIMCDFHVDLDIVAEQHGIAAGELTRELINLKAFAQHGIIRLHGRKVTVENSYRLLARTVAAVFDTYLEPDSKRHAVAV